MEIGSIAAVILLSFLGATVQGSIGIGYALVAGAGLVAVNPAFVPGPLLLIGVIVGSRHVVAERAHLDRAAWKRCLIGLPFGLLGGLIVLQSMSDRTLGIAVGTLTAIAAVCLLAGFSVQRTPSIEVVTGAATAFAAITAALPGPPFVVSFSDLSPSAMRATSASFIMVIVIIGFFSLLVTGNFAGEEFGLLAMLVPGTVGGLFASRFVRPYLDREWFRPTVLIVACLGGVVLAIRSF